MMYFGDDFSKSVEIESLNVLHSDLVYSWRFMLDFRKSCGNQFGSNYRGLAC